LDQGDDNIRDGILEAEQTIAEKEAEQR